MANILDGICPEGFILDGLDTCPGQQREGVVRINRELVASTIAEMDLDPAALAEVEEAFIGAGCFDRKRVTASERSSAMNGRSGRQTPEWVS